MVHRDADAPEIVEAAVERFSTDLASDGSLESDSGCGSGSDCGSDSDCGSGSDVFLPSRNRAPTKRIPESTDSDDNQDTEPREAKARKTTKPRPRAARSGSVSDDSVSDDDDRRKRRAPRRVKDSDSDYVPPKKISKGEYLFVRKNGQFTHQKLDPNR